ncbi:MAG TPA: tetratricopeptide repeat protein [Pirellulales bacterium]|nr:tetratricopeptide repeat protein [Pirellulales bacterium]
MSKSKAATTTEPQGPHSPLRMPIELAERLTTWVRLRPSQAAVVGGIVLVPVAPIVVLLLTLRMHASSEEMPPTFGDALAALDRGDDREAEAIVRGLDDSGPLPADELGGKPFVLGVLADRRAERLLDRARQRYETLAAEYLQQSRAMGFPPGREGQCLRLLGKDLFLSGQTSASLPVLQAALPLEPRHRTELHRLLAGAYLAEPQPKFEEALIHVRKYLAAEELSPDEREQALLERGRIELGLKEFDACRRTLEEFPKNSKRQAEALLLAGRLTSEQALALPTAAENEETRRTALQRAIETLRSVQGRAAAPPVAAASEYMVGRCQQGLGDDRAALEEFDQAASRYLETEAGVAAGFDAAELLRRENRNAESLARYRAVLGSLDRSQKFKNAWIGVDELRTRTLNVYHQFLKAKQFELAIELAGLLPPLFGDERSLQLAAEAHRQWGRRLLAQTGGSRAQVAEREDQAWRKLRKAGRLYAQLADARRAAREYPDDLYDAAECLLAGHDFTAAAAAFRQYLAAESRRRRPRALIGLGESLLAEGLPEKSLEPLAECIEFHVRDAAVYEARLLASQAKLEMGDAQAAEALLLDNLDGEALTPASQEWRDSLFALGRLLYQAGRYAEAIKRLEEAVERYPTLPQAGEARYLVAEACRRRAEQIREQAAAEATAEGRLLRQREATQLLETSLANYDQEQDLLLIRQAQGPLGPLEEAILRNCFFARGAVLFELGQYGESIEAYSSATNRYHRRPEVLEAYVQIAACYRRLGKPVEARSTLEQAKYALKHLPEEAAVDETTNYNREEWTRLLDTLDTL